MSDLGLSRRKLISGAAASAAACTGLASETGATELCTMHGVDRLEILGNQILSGSQSVRLLGVAVGDPLFVRAGRTFDDYRIIAQLWQANTVRIVAHPYHWRANASQLVRALGAEIAAARKHKLWVILAWHAIGFPGGYTERPNPTWGLPNDAFESDEETAREFWIEMSKSFGADPGIIFELWNEPIVDNRITRSTGQHWPLLKALWLRLIQLIRRNSDAIVLAAGDRFAHDLKGVAADLIDDARVAYAWHCYPLMDRDLPDRWHVSLDTLPAVKPIVVTEWGFSRSDAKAVRGTPDNFGKPFSRDVLERYRLHSTAWIWSASAGPQMLRADGSPTEFGLFVQSYLRAAWRPAIR